MINDLIFAVVFLGIIALPALITMDPHRDEKRPL